VFYHFPRALDFHKNSRATISQNQSSSNVYQGSPASEVLMMQETLLRIPHLPAKEYRKGQERGVLQDSSAREQVVLFVWLIRKTQFATVLSSAASALTSLDNVSRYTSMSTGRSSVMLSPNIRDVFRIDWRTTPSLGNTLVWQRARQALCVPVCD
jgi:hypothetical protein